MLLPHRPVLVFCPKILHRPVLSAQPVSRILMINPGAQMGRAFALDGRAQGLNLVVIRGEALEQEV